MNWLKFNRVHINYFTKIVMFPKMGEDGELMFIFAKQVEEFLKEEVHVFTMLTALGIDNKDAMEELPVVCDFVEVFPDDISDLPLEFEVEFVIDLVPGTSLISMDPYRMPASELSELKKQLEELFEKNFFSDRVFRRKMHRCC